VGVDQVACFFFVFDMKNYKRLTISIMSSSALWMILPLTLELYSTGTRTSHGWDMFWANFPSYLCRWYGVFLIVATLMHWIFARITIDLTRWFFLAFPLISLLFASVAFCIAWFIVVQFAPWDEFFYGILGVLVVVFYQMIWMTYPIALINQWLVKEILDNPISPRQSIIRQSVFLERLMVSLRNKI
jgi:hypothetical protein